MLKPNFFNSEPKLVTYRNHKIFLRDNFKTCIDKVLRHCSTDYENFKYIFMSALNEYAPEKEIRSFGVIISLIRIKN